MGDRTIQISSYIQAQNQYLNNYDFQNQKPGLYQLRGLIDDSTQRINEIGASGIQRRESDIYHKDIPINVDPMKINVLFKQIRNS